MRLELVPLILEIFAGKVKLHADFVAQRLEVRKAALQILLQIGRGVAHDLVSCRSLDSRSRSVAAASPQGPVSGSSIVVASVERSTAENLSDLSLWLGCRRLLPGRPEVGCWRSGK